MTQRRIVITGMGAISPFGVGIECLWEHLEAGATAVREILPSDRPGGMRSHVAATIPPIDSSAIDRKKRRFMSPMSIYSTLAALEAIHQAGLTAEHISGRRLGLSLASTMGSTQESESFFGEMLRSGSMEQIKSTMFFKTMNHSCAANTAQALGVQGRILAPSAACASGNLAIGLGYEAVQTGRQDIMICGGADEYHPLMTMVFDIMNAASIKYNHRPELTPRPFEVERDGVVCAEGAGILILEELRHAQQRNATIFAEIIGFSTLSSPDDLANPDTETMVDCMLESLRQGQIGSEQIDYVNAHATATERGDIAEGKAIEAVFGRAVPVSSLKGHLGHTMAASGALELIASIQSMQHKVLLATRNLEYPDERCGNIDHVRKNRAQTITSVLKNSFALGGINSTLIIRRYMND